MPNNNLYNFQNPFNNDEVFKNISEAMKKFSEALQSMGNINFKVPLIKFAPIYSASILNQEVFKSLNLISESFKGISSTLSEFSGVMQNQQELYRKMLSQINLNFSYPLSETSSSEFINTANEVITELEENPIIEANIEQKFDITEVQSNKLTWDKVMNIIMFIIALLSFLQQSLPDKHEQQMENLVQQENLHLSSIESKLQKLVDIQNRELDKLINNPTDTDHVIRNPVHDVQNSSDTMSFNDYCDD